jgi:integrase
VKKLTVDHFSEVSLGVMLNQPDTKKRSGHQDLFYMILLYDTGARDREILDLRLSDVVIDTIADRDRHII